MKAYKYKWHFKNKVPSEGYITKLGAKDRIHRKSILPLDLLFDCKTK